MPPSPRLPRFLGEYALLRPLRKGQDHLRFAVRREVQSHPRLFVVKVFDPVPDGTTEREREQYVPRLTRGLSHRNLVESYESGAVSAHPYLVMEYVLSVDLEYVLERCRQLEEPVPMEVALYLGREICRGLAFVHGFGADKLLHGRVAPSHVLMAYSGQLKLAHLHRLLPVGSTGSVETHERVGAYQAPELLEGRPVDQRADVFAVGAILWESLSGQRFELPDVSGSQVRAMATLGKASLTELNPEIPPEVAEVVARAVTLLPEDRHNTTVDLGRRLDSLLERHCEGAGGRNTSDWLVSLFRDEFRERRHVQQQLLAEKRAETQSQAILDVGDTSAFQSGELVGYTLDSRYKIKRLLGEGGMGRVYEAEHAQLGKRLAVKVLHPLYSTEEEVVERFRREARAASSIGHPNIVTVTDSGTTPDGRAYFVMELLDGMELADVIIQEGPLEYERAVDIAIQVCQALGAAHRVGIIHRDMKPENVFLTTMGGRTDVVKILDFGIAKSARLERVRGGQLTEPGLAVGTPEYMAPEQAAGKPPDPRFDIYAVGGILYAVLSGRPPHRGENVLEILTRKATRNPTPPRSYRPDIPVELERAIVSALSRNPDRRPQDMEEFEYELRKSLQGRPNAVAHMLGISDAVGVFGGRTTSSPRLPGGEGESPRLPSPSSGGGAAFELGEIGGASGGPDTPRSMSSQDDSLSLVGVDGAEPEPAQRSASHFQEPQSVPSVSDEPLDLADSGRRQGDLELDDGADDLARTDVYMPAMDPPSPAEEAPPPAPTLAPESLRMLYVLGGGFVALLLLMWLLWPSDKPPPPLPPPVASGQVAPNPSDDADATVRTGDVVPVIGLTLRIDAGLLDDETRSRRRKRTVQRWVDFTWRAARDRRYLEPARDNAKFGIEQIAGLQREHPQLDKLRKYVTRKVVGRARYRRRRGKLAEAEKMLRTLLDVAPESDRAKRALSTVLIVRGRRHLKKEELNQATDLAKESLKLDPDGLAPRFFAIDILIAEEKLEDAAEAYRQLLSKHKRNRQARRGLRKLNKRIKKQKRKGN